MNYCPNCGNAMSDEKCPCGYIPGEAKKRKTFDDGIDHRKSCSYEFRGEKCQRLGTMSHGTKGEGPWYCRDHFFGRPADNNSPSPTADWRDKLINDRMNPSDYRQSTESRSAYRARMMAEIRAGIAKVGWALPYDKTSQIEADEERAAIMDEAEWKG